MMNFETPLIWLPGMPPDEVAFEVDRLVERGQATAAWTSGEMTDSDFLDLLHDQNIDVYDLVEIWESGLVTI